MFTIAYYGDANSAELREKAADLKSIKNMPKITGLIGREEERRAHIQGIYHPDSACVNPEQ